MHPAARDPQSRPLELGVRPLIADTHATDRLWLVPGITRDVCRAPAHESSATCAIATGTARQPH